ncbi:MAG: AraC family transcriptional regulator [Clostridia bacterium]|nr:AraC family transcriptional regulator [Clostridia bacterium]
MTDYEHVAVRDIRVMEITSPRHKAQKVPGRDFYALSYRYEGEIALSANGRRLVSTPDTVTFTPKGLSYTTSVRADTRMTVVHFRLVKDIELPFPAVLDAAGSTLKQLFSELAAAYRVSTPNDFECMAIFYRILATLERIGDPHRAVPACVTEAARLIDEHFCDSSLSIADVAERVGVSDSYLRRTFKRVRGESPVEYLLRVRIQNAKNLLQTEYFTVAQIARQCGFQSSSYFTQCFRAQTGESPAQYRRRKSLLSM